LGFRVHDEQGARFAVVVDEQARPALDRAFRLETVLELLWVPAQIAPDRPVREQHEHFARLADPEVDCIAEIWPVLAGEVLFRRVAIAPLSNRRDVAPDLVRAGI